MPSVADLSVARALREEAHFLLSEAGTIDFGSRRIAEVLDRLAERLDPRESEKAPSGAPVAPVQRLVSPSGHDPRLVDYEERLQDVYEAVTSARAILSTSFQVNLPPRVAELLKRIEERSSPPDE